MSYNLFISHAWKYSDDYKKIVEMLNEAKYFSWKNYSVPEHDPFDEEEDLKRALEGQIRPVNAVIIIAGMYANHSDWIEFEVKFAKTSSKPIIVVKPWGQERIPLYLQENATVMVGWNTDSIVKAIRDYSI